MLIENSSVGKMRISGVVRLDPIDVYLEDVGPQAGKMTLTCFGKAWTAFWGATGSRNVSAFVAQANADYLVNCLERGIDAEVYDKDAARKLALADVLRDRRARLLTKKEADTRYGVILDQHLEDDYWGQTDVMQLLLGDEWLERLPMAPNPDYVYLTKIIEAVRAALASTEQPQGEH